MIDGMHGNNCFDKIYNFHNLQHKNLSFHIHVPIYSLVDPYVLIKNYSMFFKVIEFHGDESLQMQVFSVSFKMLLRVSLSVIQRFGIVYK